MTDKGGRVLILKVGSSCVNCYYTSQSINALKKADKSQGPTYVDIDTFLENF